MSRYDGLIIPRSYSEYINKTDAATLQQALQLSGVLSNLVAADDNKAVKSAAVKAAILNFKNVISGRIEFPTAPTGVQEVAVTFTPPLPNRPIAILIDWEDSANTFNYVSYVMIKSNSISENGFVAMTNRLQQDASWYARYIALY